jgi:hypothetical protein
VLLPPFPPTFSGTPADAACPAIDAPAAGLASAAPTWTTPAEPLDELPSPTCAVPTEFDDELLPAPPIPIGALAWTLLPATDADAAGVERTPLT